MLNLSIDDFDVELKDGSIRNVGAANKRATAKLYDVADVEVRAFGDERVKLVFADEDGSEVHVALFEDDAEAVAEGIEAVDLDAVGPG